MTPFFLSKSWDSSGRFLPGEGGPPGPWDSIRPGEVDLRGPFGPLEWVRQLEAILLAMVHIFVGIPSILGPPPNEGRGAAGADGGSDVGGRGRVGGGQGHQEGKHRNPNGEGKHPGEGKQRVSGEGKHPGEGKQRVSGLQEKLLE